VNSTNVIGDDVIWLRWLLRRRLCLLAETISLTMAFRDGERLSAAASHASRRVMRGEHDVVHLAELIEGVAPDLVQNNVSRRGRLSTPMNKLASGLDHPASWFDNRPRGDRGERLGSYRAPQMDNVCSPRITAARRMTRAALRRSPIATPIVKEIVSRQQA